MDDMIEYRLANEKDTDRLAELRWEHKAEEKFLDMSQKEEFVQFCSNHMKTMLRENLHCWVATVNGLIISHIYIITVRKIPKPGKLDGSWGYVAAVRTVPEYRNKGIGSALMDRAKKWCGKQNLELLIVWPSERSVPFYERAGFDGVNDILELPFG